MATALSALLYHATVAALLTHELDAVQRREWRMHPLTSWLPERIAAPVFVWAHVPLIVALQWYGGDAGSDAFRAGVAVFALVHVGLHWLARHHPRNEFRGPGPWAPILLAGACAAGHLVTRT